MAGLKYKRVLLKISGEALLSKNHNIDPSVVSGIAGQIKEVADLGVEIAIVIGGGNFWRGTSASANGVDRTTADYIGMLATIMNALGLQNALEKQGVMTRVQTSISMQQVAEPFIRRKAVRHLEKKRVVIFAGGTGNPYFTTDTAAALRALEIDAQIIFKATRVDGVYDRDPEKHSDAVKFKKLDFTTALNRDLGVMDSTAISLCRENDLPIIVFDIKVPGNIKGVIMGKEIGTLVSKG